MVRRISPNRRHTPTQLSFAAAASIAALSVAAVSLASCGDPPPCEDDRFACGSPSLDQFTQDKTCDIDGPLSVTIGEGERDFNALTPGEPPRLYYGGQGGVHTFLAARIEDADVTNSPLMVLEFYLAKEGDSNCEWGPALPTEATSDSAEDACWFQVNSRSVLVGVNGPLRTQADGSVEEAGWLVEAASLFDSDSRARVGVVARDQCGRTGHDVVEYAAGALN